MRRLLIFTILLLPLSTLAQTYPPIGQGSKLYQFRNGIKIDSAFFAPRRDTTNDDPTMLAPGMIQWRPQDQSFYGSDSTRWRKFAFGGNVIDQIDTLPTILAMQLYTGPAKVLLVTDPVRGGFFYYTITGTANDITVFDTPIGYWNRVYDASNGILIDWAGADPSGVSNSSPAIQAAINLSNHICARAGGNYLLEDSITISDKTNFVLDGKGATFTESESFYSTVVLKRSHKTVIKDLNFDGPENYTYFLTSDPSSAKQYLYIDSSDIVTVTRILGQNKRGLITFSSCSNVNLDDWVQDGIFKNGVASNVLGAFGVRTIGYGFVDPTHYLPFGSIKNGRARNTGSGILVGDNTTYISIADNAFDSTYNNGIYVSSALWATIRGNTMRKVGGRVLKPAAWGSQSLVT